jgi:hypothetical protein
MTKTFVGVVTDIRLESRVEGVAQWQLAVSGSNFQEGDSGALEAVARSGTRLIVPVLRVTIDEEGDLWHVVEKPLAAGTEVMGRVGT